MIESGYGDMLRKSIVVAKGFSWKVLSGSPEYDGLGVVRLATEVTKAQLRQFESMLSSKIGTEQNLAMGILRLAQRWAGTLQPVNTIDTDDLHYLEPAGSAAPLAAHLVYELRELAIRSRRVAIGLTSR